MLLISIVDTRLLLPTEIFWKGMEGAGMGLGPPEF